MRCLLRTVERCSFGSSATRGIMRCTRKASSEEHLMDEKKLTQRALAALTNVSRAADRLVPDLMREIKNTVRPYGLGHFFPLLRRMGFAPRHVVDVGANRGYWTRAAFKYFPNAVYTLVEPQDSPQILYPRPRSPGLQNQMDKRWLRRFLRNTTPSR